MAIDTDWFKARKKELQITDATIGEVIGRERSVVNKVLSGKVAFDLEYVESFARVLRVSREEVLRRAGVLDGSGDEKKPNAVPVKLEGASLETAREDLPIYGTALGAAREVDGEAIEQTDLNTGNVTEYVQRPVLLNRRLDAYGLYVQGSSMHPALPDGEMVAVAPNMPLRTGDNVVVYLRPTDHEDDGTAARAVLVKELVRRTARFVELRQYQPAKDFVIDASEILRIDRVLTRAEMLTNSR